MRRYSCAGAAEILQNAGQAVLGLLWQDAERTREPVEARRMLLLAVEALASSVRYSEGTVAEKSKREEFQAWIKRALAVREQKGLAPVELPLKKELPDMGILSAKALSLVEWLPNTTLHTDGSFTSPGCAPVLLETSSESSGSGSSTA